MARRFASRRFTMGLDLGSGSLRSLLLDLDSGTVFHARRAAPSRGMPGSGGLGVEFDLDEIWQAVCAASRQVLAAAGATPEEVIGVATTSMRFGSVVLDADGNTLLAGPNRDARAAIEGLTLAAQHGEALLQSSGHWPLPIFTAARLRWLQRQGDAGARAATAFSLADWLGWRLSGERATDPTHASGTLLFDLATGGWSASWCDTLEIPQALLPDIVEAGTRLGALGGDAASALGLRAGTPVSIGAADTQCGLLGAGAVDVGEATIVAGTTAPVQQIVDHPLVDTSGALWTERHCLPGTWVVESNAGPSGDALTWLARVLYPGAPHAEARLLAEAATAEPAAAGLFSSFGVQIMNGRAVAPPVGQLTLTHLSSSDDAAPTRHVARAFVEGLALGLRANLDQIATLVGVAPSATRLAGGMTRSTSFGQLLADVLATPVDVAAHPETTALGAALCAAVGAGAAADLREACQRFARSGPRYEPDSGRSATYHELAPKWRALQAATPPEAAAFVTPWMLRAVDATSPVRSDAPRPKILSAADLDADARDALGNLGELEYASFRDKKRLLTGPSLVEALAGVDVFITEIDIVDAASLAALPQLRVVAACRGDAVNVDVAACTAHGIPVLFAPGRNADAVADLTVGFLLALARKLPKAAAFLRQPDIRAGDMGKMGQAFSTLQGHELWRRSIGLVGLGAVGRGVARRLSQFGARVLVADPFVSSEQAAAVDAELVPLDTLLAECDFVSLHAAVTDATQEMIGAAELARMKPGAFLVNTARAALTDEDALADALASGQLGGLAVDTFSVEPPGSDHPLLGFDNVIATPHVGGNTKEIAAHQGASVALELGRLLRGEQPTAILNPEVLEGFSWTGPRPTPDARAAAALAKRPAPAVTDLQRDRKRGSATPRATAPTASTAQPKAETNADATPKAPTASSEQLAAARAGMRRLLDTFAEGIESDAALSAFAADKDVTLHFALGDLGLDFALRLSEGKVTAGVGAPDGEAHVQLRLRATTLNGMFKATLNPMDAAMKGDIAFTGDAAKAMTLQHMQGDLERLYQVARDAVGEPDGLDDLPIPGAAAGDTARVAAAGPSDVRHAIVRTVEELYAQELITATGGNVSARIDDSDEIWITPSQLFKGDLAAELLVRTDLAGRSLDPGARSPSSEWDLHCALYRARPEVRAVVHAHAPHATILANTGLPFVPISTEAAFFGEIARVPFIMPGTKELADRVAEAMADDWAVLMVNHGLIVAGRSLRRAADMIEIIDRTAQVILGCHAVGREPPTLPDDVVKRLRELGDLVA